MGDTSAIQIGAGAAGLVSASAVIMILLQRAKDYWPSLQGRGAMFACDVVSAVVAFTVIYQTTPNWWQGVTYIALVMLTLSFGVTARALFAQMFHVAVANVPASSEATVQPEDVNDPQADDPYERELRKPVASTRPMTEKERVEASRRPQ